MENKLLYYPGCTLKTKAANLEKSAIACMKALGIPLEEMQEWTCCGANFSLSADNLMKYAAPIRNLARAQKQADEVVTICSACYNVLKRANYVVENSAEKLEKVNMFLEDALYDDQYTGKVKVLHLLEAIEQKIGFDKLKTFVKKPLNNLKIAPYYGCNLIRPRKEMGFDDQEAPEILHNFIEALGGVAIDYPMDVECCGAYVVINKPKEVWRASYRILSSARAEGADILVTSCPLCLYNLDKYQEDMRKEHSTFKPIPILYFTQLLALALGLEKEDISLEGNLTDPKPILKEAGLI